jgi:hypothetical protein
MSNSQATKSRVKQNKKRSPSRVIKARKARLWVPNSSVLALDDESLSNMASLEWLNFDDQDKENLTSIGIPNLEAYIDVRVGMKHSSSEELIDWATGVYVGHVKNEDDLEHYFDLQIQALSMAARLDKYYGGIDIIARAKAATRNLKISNTIRWHDLPSGAKYYYAPYDVGTDEHIVWLLKYSRKFERPWLGKPF